LANHDFPAPKRAREQRMDRSRVDLARERVHRDEDRAQSGQEVERVKREQGHHRGGERVEIYALAEGTRPARCAQLVEQQPETNAEEHQKQHTPDENEEQQPLPSGLFHGESSDLNEVHGDLLSTACTKMSSSRRWLGTRP